MALNELYYNLSVFVYPACPVAPADGTGVAPADGTGACPVKCLWFLYLTGVGPADRTGVTLWLNYV